MFIVHARSAWLKGLSPRKIASAAARLFARASAESGFSFCTVRVNGGIATLNAAREHLEAADGVMLGRAAYHDPYLLAGVDCSLFGGPSPAPTRHTVVMKMTDYLQRQTRAGTAPRHVVRHMLGLFQGLRGARQWRRTLSDANALERYGADILTVAMEAVREPNSLSAIA